MLDEVAARLETLSKNLSSLLSRQLLSAIPRSRSSRSIPSAADAPTGAGWPRTGRHGSRSDASCRPRAPAREDREAPRPEERRRHRRLRARDEPGTDHPPQPQAVRGHRVRAPLRGAREARRRSTACRAFRPWSALPETVDLAVVSVPAPAATEVVEALARRDRAESIILIPGGFGEAGRARPRGDDSARRSRPRTRAPDGGPVLVGGNCLGIVSKRAVQHLLPPAVQAAVPRRAGRPPRGRAARAARTSFRSRATSTASCSRARRSRTATRWTSPRRTSSSTSRTTRPSASSSSTSRASRRCDGERFARVPRAASRRKAGTSSSSRRARRRSAPRPTRSHTASLAGDYAVAKRAPRGRGRPRRAVRSTCSRTTRRSTRCSATGCPRAAGSRCSRTRASNARPSSTSSTV